MATHKSAAKASRQAEGNRQVNRRNRSRMRTQLKKIRAVADAGNQKEAEALLTPTIALIDRSVRLGVIHRNAAARTKSRLCRQVKKLAAGS